MLKGVLPKDYARPGLDEHRLGQLVDLVSSIGLGDEESRSKDVLANPPFNDNDWRGDLLKDDERRAFGVPHAGNANLTRVQRFIHHGPSCGSS